MEGLLGLSGHLHGVKEVGFPMSAMEVLRSQSDIFNNKAHALVHTVKHTEDTIYLRPEIEKENKWESGRAGKGMRHHSRTAPLSSSYSWKSLANDKDCFPLLI